jgi:putative ABC transport system permease protein
MKTIQLPQLSIIIIPTVFLLVLIFRWQLKVWVGLYASARMLVQLLLVVFFITFVLETTQPVVIMTMVIIILGVSAWIILRSLELREVKTYLIVLTSIGVPRLIILMLVTQFVLEMPRWFELHA